jgi:hypothetical protein
MRFLNSTPAEVTLKDGVTSVVTGLAAHKSISEGRVVEIKELWGWRTAQSSSIPI